MIISTEPSRIVKVEYGWTLKGSWSTDRIEKLLDHSSRFATAIFNLTSKPGAAWIRNNLGNASLHCGTLPNLILRLAHAGGMVLTKTDVLLKDSFSEYILIHEMGHVLDNNFKNGILPATYTGGGAADLMVAAMGGRPRRNFPRFSAKHQWYLENVAGNSPWDIPAYGNHGVADDFADTFAHTILGHPVPEQRQAWMTDFLSSLPLNLHL